MLTFLKRVWVPLVVVAAAGLGGLAVDQAVVPLGSDEIFFCKRQQRRASLEPSHLKRSDI